MSVFSQVSGTLVNVGAIVVGTLLGLAMGGRLPQRTQLTLLQVLSPVALFIGLDMASQLGKVSGHFPGVVVALLAYAAGVILGEGLGIEERLTALGERLKHRFRGGGQFTEGFVAASLLFCIGPMAIIGGIQNGLTGDTSTYTLKSVIDGISALALAGVYGLGVGFSALPVLVLQGGISLAAGSFASGLLGSTDPALLKVNPAILMLTGTGGLMIVCIGVNLMLAGLGFSDKRVRVGSMLPALLLAPLLWALFQRIG